jgi:hypothetical protein
MLCRWSRPTFQKCLLHPSLGWCVSSDDEGCKYLWNVGLFLQDYRAQYSRRLSPALFRVVLKFLFASGQGFWLVFSELGPVSNRGSYEGKETNWELFFLYNLERAMLRGSLSVLKLPWRPDTHLWLRFSFLDFLQVPHERVILYGMPIISYYNAQNKKLIWTKKVRSY